jgi:hypothetical protein
MEKDGFGTAIVEWLFPFVKLFRTMWRILRHPFAFDDYIHSTPKQIASFFFVSVGLSAFFWKFEQHAVDLASASLNSVLDEVNALVHLAIPKYDVGPLLLIPLMVLVWSVFFAFAFHGLWWLGRYLLSDRVKRILRKGEGVPGRPLRTILGACIFSAGLSVLLLTVLPAMAVVASTNLTYQGTEVSLDLDVHNFREFIAFLLMCVAMYSAFILFIAAPLWFARIYGLRLPVSYIMTFAVIIMIILPYAAAKPNLEPEGGFAEDWVASGFLVFFDFDSDLITEKGHAILQHVAAVASRAAKAGTLTNVEIGGSIDTAEAADGPPDLAWRRGVAVGQTLTALGVPREFVFARSLGSGHLLVFTPKNVREPQNRFATITIRAYGTVIGARESP